MAQSLQIRLVQPVSLHKAPLPQTVFVDRDGDVWVADGHNARGELVLTCPHPLDPRESEDGDGVGEPYSWTLREVQQAFGPLIARSAVAA